MSSRHSTRCVPPGAITSATACRAAERRRGNQRRARSRCPTTVVGPTPRSQIRMRTDVRRLDMRELDVGAAPETSRGARARAPAAGSARRRAAAPGRRTAGCRTSSRRRCSDSPPPRSPSPAADRPAAHRRAKRLARSVDGRCAQPLDARLGVDGDVDRGLRSSSRSSSAARPRTPLPDTSDRLPSALAAASTRRRPSGVVEDQAVRADAGVPLAQLARQGVERPAPRTSAARARRGSRCRRRALSRISIISGRTRAGASRSGGRAAAAAR